MTNAFYDKKYAIITHKLFSGAGQELYRFLKQQDAKYVLLIEHNFSSSPNRKTIVTEYTSNSERIKEYYDYKFLPDSIVYIKDFVSGFFTIVFIPNKFHIVVGCGGFNALCALLLKKLGRTQCAIFYTIDYVPKRFDNKFLNKIYHAIDKICVKYCDQVWNLSPRMAEGREIYNGMPRSQYNNQKVVPIGIWLEDLPQKNEKFDKKSIVFVGHLLEKQGVQLILRAIPKISNQVPDIQFIIIGTGNFEKGLKSLVEGLKIGKYVHFCGPIYDQDILYKTISKCHIAVAMYNKEIDTFTYYADPTKLKTYLSAGLPILVSDVPYNARELEKQKCGIIIDDDVDSIAEKIIDLFANISLLNNYSINARNYIKKFDWNIIFKKAMEDIKCGP